MSVQTAVRPTRSPMRRVAICIIAAVIASVIFTSSGVADSPDDNTRISRIYFSFGNAFSVVSLSFAADLSWNDALNLTKGEAGSIRYAFAPGPADLTVFLPLAKYLGIFGIDDIRLNIPLGDTPLEEHALSLTGLLGIPEWLASVDLVLEPSLMLYDVVCSNPLGQVGVDMATMTWHDWSDKSITYLCDDVGAAVISANFCYTFSLGIELTMLADSLEYDLIPEITLLSLRGSQAALTSIAVHEPVPSWIDKNGLAAVSFVVEGLAIYAVILVASRVFRG